MNYQWNREQKWNGVRVNMVSTLSEGPKLRYLLEDKNNEGFLQKRAGTVVPGADNFVNLIPADHKISVKKVNRVTIIDMPWWYKIWQLSGHNPAHVKQKLFHETQKSLMKFLELSRKPKVIYTDNSLEFGKACEDLSWNHWTSTPHRSETNGIAEKALRRIKEGTSAVLLQSGLDQNGGRIPWSVTAICETFKISCLMGRHHVKGVSEYHLMARLLRLERW